MPNGQSADAVRVVAYLGAGASRFAGYHTFVDFPELLFNKGLREADGMPLLSPNPERILRAIRDSLERNNKATTHDNFLWRLDGYAQLLRLNQSDDVLQEFLKESGRLHDLHICTEQAVEQITATTIRHYSSNKVERAKQSNGATYESLRRVFDIYRAMAGLNGPNQYLPIFTTNYDMLIEDMVTEFGGNPQPPMTLKTGIPGLLEEGAPWTSHEFEYSDDGPRGLHLHRLHGCVCWFSEHERDSAVSFHRRHALQYEISRLCAMYPGRQTEIGVSPHGPSFQRFYRLLRSCDVAVFIGFSFRDDDVMHVVLKALAERRGKPRLLVIDPLYTRVDVQRRLKDAARRFAFPPRVPRDGEIESIQMRFGEAERSDWKILEACERMLHA